MIQVLDSKEYLSRMVAGGRPGAEKLLAFYEHRVGAICRDPALMLMPWDDHLVHRGDGVFETLKYVDGRIYQLEAHLERMKRSGAAIFLEPPCSYDAVREIIVEVIRAGGDRTGLARVLLGRGPGGFGIYPSECPRSSLYVAVYKFTPKSEEAFERGVTAFRTSIPAKQNWLARIKSIDYLPNVLMKREAEQGGYDFPVCYDDRGRLAEGATENVCLVDASGRVVVPDLSNCLAGTTLLRAVELIRGEVPVKFQDILEQDVFAAREMIILGTTNDALSIVRYGDRPVGDGRPGPVSRRMRALLLADIRENGLAF